MTVCILGTRGIPNNHGGFERFAEELSVRLAEQGHEVRVYNPSTHPFRGKTYNNVKIIRKWFPRFMGPAAPLVFDLLCLAHALRSGAEVILQCGYTSSLWLPLFPSRKKKKIITHMDGMEWQRAKWGWLTIRFIRWTEKLAVKYSDVIVADHMEIKKYYRKIYGVEAEYLSYGIQKFKIQNSGGVGKDSGFKIQNSVGVGMNGVEGFEEMVGETFYLIIARIEPENNLEMMIEGFLRPGTEGYLLIFGDAGTRYGKKLVRKYRSRENILFAGAVYDQEILDRLRLHCRYYLHGHSAGGTNPSLLEAMAADCAILAHDNPFNRGVLKGFGNYFACADDLAVLLKQPPETAKRKEQVEYVTGEYNWEKVTERMLGIMTG